MHLISGCKVSILCCWLIYLTCCALRSEAQNVLIGYHTPLPHSSSQSILTSSLQSLLTVWDTDLFLVFLIDRTFCEDVYPCPCPNLLYGDPPPPLPVLMLGLFLYSCWRRHKGLKESVYHVSAHHGEWEDIRENVLNYDEEGGGEHDQV